MLGVTCCFCCCCFFASLPLVPRRHHHRRDHYFHRGEKIACKSLLKPDVADEDEEMADDGEYNIFASLKKEEEDEKEAASKYIDTRIFLSSAATVEQLWSEADAILVKHRRRMNPIILECLLFLKSNRHLWGQD